jgi:hypothetical protein
MLYLNLPDTAKIGGTYDCKINGEPKRVDWREFNTLVIEPDHVHSIISTQRSSGLIAFFARQAARATTPIPGHRRDQSSPRKCDA